MEQRIFKYELAVTDGQNISMPKGAEILTVQMQHGKPCLWALVNPTANEEIRFIEMYGTGLPIVSDMGATRQYISTIQLRAGDLIFHVFEYTGV